MQLLTRAMFLKDSEEEDGNVKKKRVRRDTANVRTYNIYARLCVSNAHRVCWSSTRLGAETIG